MLIAIRSTPMCFAAVVALLPVSPLLSHAQADQGSKSTVMKDTAQKSRGIGSDANIRERSVLNDPNPEAAPKAPPEKGGQQSRMEVCALTIDNHTPWKIQIFADGEQVGLVSPWGKVSGTYRSGQTVLYGVAEFTNGGALTWGPRTVSSCSGNYTWELYEQA
jgi:hypothetical protein